MTGHRLLDGGIGGDVLGTAGCGKWAGTDDGDGCGEESEEVALCINLFKAYLPSLPANLGAGSVVLDVKGIPTVNPALNMLQTGRAAHDACREAVGRALREIVVPAVAVKDKKKNKAM